MSPQVLEGSAIITRVVFFLSAQQAKGSTCFPQNTSWFIQVKQEGHYQEFHLQSPMRVLLDFDYLWECFSPFSTKHKNKKTLLTTTDAKTGCTEHRFLNFTTVFRRRIVKLRKQTN